MSEGGYYGYSKSNRAIAAENKGLMTATAFARWVRQWKRYSGAQAADISAVLFPAEWHHTSSWYNETDYYDPTELARCDKRLALRDCIAKRKVDEKADTAITLTECEVSWTEWQTEWKRGRPRNRPKRRTETGCSLTFRRTKQSVSITLATGVVVRKQKRTIAVKHGGTPFTCL